MKTLAFKLNPAVYSLQAVMAAAYELTDRAYADISLGKKKILVRLTLKEGAPISPALLKKVFLKELREQVIRGKVFKENAALRESVIISALSGNKPGRE